MKNYYYVKIFMNGKIFYISHYANGIYCVTRDRERAIYFTNKRKAATQGKYFINYVMSEYSVFEVIKDN